MPAHVNTLARSRNGIQGGLAAIADVRTEPRDQHCGGERPALRGCGEGPGEHVPLRRADGDVPRDRRRPAAPRSGARGVLLPRELGAPLDSETELRKRRRQHPPVLFGEHFVPLAVRAHHPVRRVEAVDPTTSPRKSENIEAAAMRAFS